MASQTDRLVELIKSLTPAEKRFFRDYRRRNDTKRIYLKLFDQINRKTNYGIKYFPKQGKNEAPVRKYLYDSILEALRILRADSSRYIKVLNNIIDAKVLQEKGLFFQAEKKLNSAYKATSRYGFEVLQLNILLEKRALARERKHKKSEELIQYLKSETRTKLLELQNYLDILDHYDVIFVMDRNSQPDSVQREMIIQEFKDSIYDFDGHQLSKSGKILLLWTKILTQKISEGRFAKSPEPFKELVELYESDPKFLKENMGKYISIINNWLINSYLNKDISDFPTGLSKLDQLRPSRRSEKVKLFRVKYHLTLLKYFLKDEYEECLSIIPEIENGLLDYFSEIPSQSRYVFIQNISSVYFHTRQFSEARRWINKILNDTQKDIRQDLRTCSQLFEIFILIEEDDQILEKNIDLITTKCKSFVYKYKQLGEPNETIKLAYDLSTILLNLLKDTESLDKPKLYREFKKIVDDCPETISWKREIEYWLSTKLN